jgi:uncharacterized phage protein gp47/JayE
MTAITSTGFDRTKLDELLLDLQNSMIDIFGSDVDISPSSIDGQHLGIFADRLDSVTMLAEDVYHSFNPQTALGVALQRLVQLNGIRAIDGQKSTCLVKLGGVVGAVIPEGSLISNPTTKDVFQTLTPATISGTGFTTVNAECLTFGAILAPVGSLTKIDSPTYQWQTVTNDVPAIPGRAAETDEQLRIRRAKSTATPSQALFESLEGSLNNLPAVTQVKLLENFTDIVDGNGTLAHGIHAIVQGGLDADIAKTIWLKKSLGSDMNGSTTVVVNDSDGNPHTIKFSRPSPRNIYVTINIVQRPSFPSTGANDIKDAIVAWALDGQSIGEEVIQSRLFEPVNATPNHSVTSLFIGFSASPTLSANLTLAYNELAIFDQSRIIVNVT